MNTDLMLEYPKKGLELIQNAWEYSIDSWQRQILFMDTKRQQGNNFIKHIEDGQPPVITFDYEIIMDGSKLDRPVNYSLARILQNKGVEISPNARPVVVIDPRAGHGPGIGGSKEESAIGVALKDKHPVYFILFYPDPIPAQTLSDIQKAEIIFIEKIGELHPEADKPAIIGNCQAGWAVALMAADKPEIAGPLILNGSPLSYWAGKDGSNPMRYKGGLIGGIWMASFLADLGNGKFDGANLVKGFEDLNPANTLWEKNYNLYSKIDTEVERFLTFEKWWTGFYYMTKEEITFITENLFVGNKLEQGGIELESGNKIDLKNLEEPIILFCSEGDNITPPTQALNWVIKVWGTVEEIKRQQQVIIYLVHKDIGHLGIFVSGKVVNKEHKQMIGNVDLVEFLAPGFYEMVIGENHNIMKTPKTKGDVSIFEEYNVKFVEREFEDIMGFDDGVEDEEDFETVNKISVLNNTIYETVFSPFVKTFTNEVTAAALRVLHPLRSNRYLFSDLNPFLGPFKSMAEYIKENRQTVSSDNPFLNIEKSVSDSIVSILDLYRDYNDFFNELRFKIFYENPFIDYFFGGDNEEREEKKKEKGKKEKNHDWEIADKQHWLSLVTKGGLEEGVARIMVAVAGVDKNIDHTELKTMGKIMHNHMKISKAKKSDLKRLLQEQARVLQIGKSRAISALPMLIKTKKDRKLALKIADIIATADNIVVGAELELLERLHEVLDTE